MQVAELKRRTQEQAGRLKEAEAAAEAARREASRVRLHAVGGLSPLLCGESHLQVWGVPCSERNLHALDGIQAAEANGQLEGELQAAQQQRASGTSRSGPAGSVGADTAAAQLSPRVPSPQEGGARCYLCMLYGVSVFDSN